MQLQIQVGRGHGGMGTRQPAAPRLLGRAIEVLCSQKAGRRGCVATARRASSALAGSLQPACLPRRGHEGRDAECSAWPPGGGPPTRWHAAASPACWLEHTGPPHPLGPPLHPTHLLPPPPHPAAHAAQLAGPAPPGRARPLLSRGGWRRVHGGDRWAGRRLRACWGEVEHCASLRGWTCPGWAVQHVHAAPGAAGTSTAVPRKHSLLSPGKAPRPHPPPFSLPPGRALPGERVRRRVRPRGAHQAAGQAAALVEGVPGAGGAARWSLCVRALSREGSRAPSATIPRCICSGS